MLPEAHDDEYNDQSSSMSLLQLRHWNPSRISKTRLSFLEKYKRMKSHLWISVRHACCIILKLGKKHVNISPFKMQGTLVMRARHQQHVTEQSSHDDSDMIRSMLGANDMT